VVSLWQSFRIWNALASSHFRQRSLCSDPSLTGAHSPGQGSILSKALAKRASFKSCLRSFRLVSVSLAHHLSSFASSLARWYCRILQNISPSLGGFSLRYSSASRRQGERERSDLVSVLAGHIQFIWCLTYDRSRPSRPTTDH
jgi:hypothetical protein